MIKNKGEEKKTERIIPSLKKSYAPQLESAPSLRRPPRREAGRAGAAEGRGAPEGLSVSAGTGLLSPAGTEASSWRCGRGFV